MRARRLRSLANMPAASDDDDDVFERVAEEAVSSHVDNMPLLQQPLEERRILYTPGTPLDFYGARDGKLHANGMVFHIKGINWCARRAVLG